MQRTSLNQYMHQYYKSARCSKIAFKHLLWKMSKKILWYIQWKSTMRPEELYIIKYIPCWFIIMHPVVV